MNGELSAGEAAALEAAIAGDPRLQAEYRRLQNALAVARQLPAEPLPESFHAAMQADLDLLEQPLRERFSDLIDGTLSAPEAASCRAAIEAVPGLAAELAWVEQVVATCHDWPDEPLPAGFAQQLTARLDAVDALRAQPAGERPSRSLRPAWAGLRPRPLRLAWAGLLLIVLGFGSVSVRHLPLRNASEAEIAVTPGEPARSEAVATAASHRALATPDTEARPATVPTSTEASHAMGREASSSAGTIIAADSRDTAATAPATSDARSPRQARPVAGDAQESRLMPRHGTPATADRPTPRVNHPASREVRPTGRAARPAPREVRPASREVRMAAVMRPAAGAADERASRGTPRAGAPAGPVAVPRPAPAPSVREATLTSPASLGVAAGRTTPAAEMPAPAPAARASLVPTAPGNPAPAPEPAATTPERRPWFQVSLPPRERPTMVATAAPDREIPSPRLLNRHATAGVALDFTPAPPATAAPGGPAFEVEGGGQAD